jgi:hypothetical protein
VTDQTIRITPAVLRQMAGHHDSIAAEIAAVRTAGRDILAAVATHGPIMHRFKTAVADAVTRRGEAFAAYEADHRAAADKLRAAADRFADQDDVNAARLHV